MQGTIKRLVMDRGFGFLSGEDGVEYFFHRSSMSPASAFETLAEGDRLSFTPDPAPSKGPRASDVRAA